MTARDGAMWQRVRESFVRQRVMAHLGARLADVGHGRCIIELPFREELTQQHGFIHGGVVGTIADSATGYAGLTTMPPGAGVLTVEYKLNLLAPAKGERLIAEGSVVRSGRTLVITRADVFAEEGGRRRPCATMLETLMAITERPDLAPG